MSEHTPEEAVDATVETPAQPSAWKSKPPVWLWAVLGVALVVIGLVLANTLTKERDNDDTINSGPNPAPTQVDGVNVPGLAGALGAPYTVGDAAAPVTVAIYSDLQCPFCAQFHEASSQLINAAVKSGNAKAEYYVASFLGEPSVRAANALACASEQGAFNTYLGTVYLNQGTENSADAFSDAALIRMAELSQVASIPDFEQCLKSNKYSDYVASINDAMLAAGYTQTPTVLIDGEVVDLDTLTFEQFEALINGARP